MNTPVLFMIFNRPETTARVFEAIKEAQPKKLFIAADGPRPEREGEIYLCEETRRIATQVTWECEVKTLFRDQNLGCGKAPAENITWFFRHVETGIILEDDCLPHPTFFYFCEQMLVYYANNPLVGQITGNNFQHGKKISDGSYYFSKYFHICGWATWRNRWKDYSFDISSADAIVKEKIIEKRCATRTEVRFWHRKLEMLRGGKRNDIWDYQWMFANWYLQRLSVVPNVNLISNIGFTQSATHTVRYDPRVADLPTYPISVTTHPPRMSIDLKADHYTFFDSGAFFQPTHRDRIRWTLKRLFPKSVRKHYKKIISIRNLFV